MKRAAGSGKRRVLWRCGKCRRLFANRNQSHACGALDLEHHFRGKSAEIRELFDSFVTIVRSIGAVRILPEKTRIAFQVRMSFAQVTPRQRWLDGHVVLARRLEHPRFRKVETFSPRNHMHVFRLTSQSDLDGQLRGWLEEAYRVGEQRHLSAPRLRKSDATNAAVRNTHKMTAAEFRRLALSMPEAIESAHMNHPDFRVGGKIFATLSPGEEYGVVMLSPEEQKEFVAIMPKAFAPVKGAWGRNGSTRVELSAVKLAPLRKAMAAAWRRRSPRRLLEDR